MPKLYTGPRGGLYYKKKGRKIYVNRFGVSDNDTRSTPSGSVGSAGSAGSIDSADLVEFSENRIIRRINLILRLLDTLKDKNTNTIVSIFSEQIMSTEGGFLSFKDLAEKFNKHMEEYPGSITLVNEFSKLIKKLIQFCDWFVDTHPQNENNIFFKTVHNFFQDFLS